MPTDASPATGRHSRELFGRRCATSAHAYPVYGDRTTQKGRPVRYVFDALALVAKALTVEIEASK